MPNLTGLRKELNKAKNPAKAKIFQRFFKTGKGEYGEGDVFLGLSVPQSRTFARKYHELSYADIKKLLGSKFHEERLIALLILTRNFASGGEKLKKEIFNFYLKNARFVNNWDLVDLSADKIAGAYLFKKDKAVLYRLARSKNLWERRIAIIATYHFIKNSEYGETLKIAKILLTDEHDLIHKAIGWMLREVGKKSLSAEEKFLKKHYKTMPRTALRYAIERFPKPKRMAYLKGKI